MIRVFVTGPAARRAPNREAASSLSAPRVAGQGQGRRRRLFEASCVLALWLGVVACDPPCVRNSDCARGYRCERSTCVVRVDPEADGGLGPDAGRADASVDGAVTDAARDASGAPDGAPDDGGPDDGGTDDGGPDDGGPDDGDADLSVDGGADA